MIPIPIPETIKTIGRQGFVKFLWINALMSSALVHAQQTFAPHPIESVSLSGSLLSLDDAAKISSRVFVGTIARIGMPQLKSAGEYSYHDVEVDISQTLKGASLASMVLVLHVKFGKVVENPPITGSEYIFFVKEIKGENRAIKILHSDEEVLKSVRRLIDTSP